VASADRPSRGEAPGNEEITNANLGRRAGAGGSADVAGRGASVKVVVAGATGWIGRALVPALCASGYEVYSLVRRPAREAREIAWQPASGILEAGALAGADVVINLAGENIAAGRWTEARRDRILRSRVDSTRTLVREMTQLKSRPRLFVCASAVGYYGSRGEEMLSETSPLGLGFLPGVCLAWETHAAGAARSGIRTVTARFGVVIGRGGGALARLRPIFRAGLGGRLSSGDQWMSWVSLDDAVGAILYALTEESLAGPCNVVAPVAVTNRQFTEALAAALRRPSILPIPALALRLLLGAMAEETLLASTRVTPRRLLDAGYRFRHERIEAVLADVLADRGDFPPVSPQQL
jgi:uncharacterized protein (TIGR01777 family)